MTVSQAEVRERTQSQGTQSVTSSTRRQKSTGLRLCIGCRNNVAGSQTGECFLRSEGEIGHAKQTEEEEPAELAMEAPVDTADA